MKAKNQPQQLCHSWPQIEELEGWTCIALPVWPKSQRNKMMHPIFQTFKLLLTFETKATKERVRLVMFESVNVL